MISTPHYSDIKTSSSCCTLYLHCYQRLILNLHNLFTLWRALSNQTVPYQALTKIKKRATTKIEKVKVIQLLASSHPQKVVFPSPRPNWPLSLSLAINCQCLLHWTNHLAAKLNAVAKLNVFNPPGLLEEKYLVPPHTSPPPGSTCRVFTSPPPPLVIRKLQGGGTSNLVPNKSCQ